MIWILGRPWLNIELLRVWLQRRWWIGWWHVLATIIDFALVFVCVCLMCACVSVCVCVCVVTIE